jgi:hypothetical protein
MQQQQQVKHLWQLSTASNCTSRVHPGVPHCHLWAAHGRRPVVAVQLQASSSSDAPGADDRVSAAADLLDQAKYVVSWSHAGMPLALLYLQAPKAKRKRTRRKDPAEVSANCKAAAHKLVEYEGEMIPAYEKASRIAGEKLTSASQELANRRVQQLHFSDTCM